MYFKSQPHENYAIKVFDFLLTSEVDLTLHRELSRKKKDNTTPYSKVLFL